MALRGPTPRLRRRHECRGTSICVYCGAVRPDCRAVCPVRVRQDPAIPLELVHPTHFLSIVGQTCIKCLLSGISLRYECNPPKKEPKEMGILNARAYHPEAHVSHELRLNSDRYRDVSCLRCTGYIGTTDKGAAVNSLKWLCSSKFHPSHNILRNSNDSPYCDFCGLEGDRLRAMCPHKEQIEEENRRQKAEEEERLRKIEEENRRQRLEAQKFGTPDIYGWTPMVVNRFIGKRFKDTLTGHTFTIVGSFWNTSGNILVFSLDRQVESSLHTRSDMNVNDFFASTPTSSRFLEVVRE